jgi:TonB family protein
MAGDLNTVFMVVLAIVSGISWAASSPRPPGEGGVGLGFGIAALVVFVLSLGVPIYGNYITLIALMFATISALGRSVVWPIVLSSVSAIKLFMLSPTWIMLIAQYGGSYILTTLVFLAAPLVGMALAKRSSAPAGAAGARHGAVAAAQPAPAPPRPADDDIASWDRIADKDDADSLQEYLLRHPAGRFAELARMKLERIGVKPLKPAIPDPLPAPAADLLFPPETARAAPERIEPPKSDDLLAGASAASLRPAQPKRGAAVPLVVGGAVVLALVGGGAFWVLTGGLGSGRAAEAASGAAMQQAEASEPPPVDVELPPPPPAALDAAAAEPSPAGPAAPSPAFTVEPFRPSTPIVVTATNVRVRAAPFANDETQVVGRADTGQTLAVTGRVRQDDWTWYRLVTADGGIAFIRSDLTSAPLPGTSPPRAVLPDFEFEPPQGAENAVVPGGPATDAIELRPGAQARPGVRPIPDTAAIVRMMQESYPAEARRLGQQGAVTVAMCVDANGRASNVRLLKSSGSAALDQATTEGVQLVRFTPGKDGEGKAIDWCDPPYALTVDWKLAG